MSQTTVLQSIGNFAQEAGFPETDDKTLISKILNGSRSLTKDHIKKLAEWFDISPALFFY